MVRASKEWREKKKYKAKAQKAMLEILADIPQETVEEKEDISLDVARWESSKREPGKWDIGNVIAGNLVVRRPRY